MTDPLRPNPLGLPLDPDPTLSDLPVEMPGGDATGGAIDDPVVWPVDRPGDPDGRGLDLPRDDPDAVEPGTDLPDAQLA